MDFDGNIIYIIFAIGYFVYKIFFGGDKKNTPKKTSAPTPQNRHQPATPSTNRPKAEPTLEDIFETLVNKPKASVAPPPKAIMSEAKKAHMVSQKRVQDAQQARLISQKKYQSHSIGNSKWKEPLVPLELVEFEEEAVNQSISFNFDDLDWPTAVVAKEILDRKFT